MPVLQIGKTEGWGWTMNLLWFSLGLALVAAKQPLGWLVMALAFITK